MDTASKSKASFVVGPSGEGRHEVGTLYFGYGSNLSSTQMCSRCPSSEAIGLGYLPGYKFIINQRGFANVVPVGVASPKQQDQADEPSSPQGEKEEANVTTIRDGEEQSVYGVIYKLGEDDEELLDGFEGVSIGCYTKEMRDVQVLGSSGEWQTKPALVYIDRLRTREDAPRREYIARMNRGIDEAMREWGLPKEYVDSVIRRFIPSTPRF